jgi:hypothetical protein
MAGTRLLGSQDSNSIRRKASRARGARVLNRRGCVRALARRGTATWPDERRARVSRSRERGDPARRTGVRRGTSEVVTGWSGSLSRRAQGVCGLRRRTTEFSDEPRRPFWRATGSLPGQCIGGCESADILGRGQQNDTSETNSLPGERMFACGGDGPDASASGLTAEQRCSSTSESWWKCPWRVSATVRPMPPGSPGR